MMNSERMQNSAGFNSAVHGLRGLAAMMVFLAHVLNGLREHAYPEATQFLARSEGWWNFGTYGVYLFFTISGYVILPSAMRYGAGEFAARRFFRVYPLFFVMTLVFIALNTVTGLQPGASDPYAILVALTFMDLFTPTEQLTPNAWSLTFEVFFYALTCLVVVHTVKRPSWLGGAISVALALAFALAFPVTIFFVLGLVARVAHDRGILVPRNLAAVLELVLIAGLVAIASRGHFAYTHAEVVDPVALATIAATGLYFFMAASPGSVTGRVMTWRPLLWVGTVSYSLYLVHPYIYLPMRMAFQKLGWFGDDILISGLVFFPAVILPTLIVTRFVHRTVETSLYRAVFQKGVFAGTRRTAQGAPTLR